MPTLWQIVRDIAIFVLIVLVIILAYKFGIRALDEI